MIKIMPDDYFLESLFRSAGAVQRSLRRGEQLFASGDSVCAVHLVTSGRIDLLRRRENGNPVILHGAVSGEVVAEASAFAGEYHCDAEAATKCALLSLPLSHFHTLLGKPAFAALWARYLSRQLIRARGRAEILAHRRVGERLDLWLALNKHLERPPWNMVAAELGVSAEALYRELAIRRIVDGEQPFAA